MAGCLQDHRFLGGCGVCMMINTAGKAWHRPSMTHLNMFSGWKGGFTKVVQDLHSG